MAMLETECTHPECGWVVFENSRTTTCPECGAPTRSFADEEPDYDYEEDYDGD